MKRFFSTWTLLMLILIGATSCGSTSDTVTVAKPRYHKSWPKSHKDRKRLHVWKFTFQWPERGGLKKVKMKN